MKPRAMGTAGINQISGKERAAKPHLSHSPRTRKLSIIQAALKLHRKRLRVILEASLSADACGQARRSRWAARRYHGAFPPSGADLTPLARARHNCKELKSGAALTAPKQGDRANRAPNLNGES